MKNKLIVFFTTVIFIIINISFAVADDELKNENNSIKFISDSNPLGAVNIEQQKWYTAEDRAQAREYISPRNSRAQKLSIADIIIPAGVEVIEHRHIMEEVYYVVEGEGIMRVNGIEQVLKKGDAVVILPNERHNIKNMSATIDLRLIVTCTPAWMPELLIFEPKK